jgi:hypothetical protein
MTDQERPDTPPAGEEPVNQAAGTTPTDQGDGGGNATPADEPAEG